MLKKPTSKSAFFNVRALTGMFLLSSGAFLGLAGAGAIPTLSAQKNQPVDTAKADPQAEFSPADDNGRFVYLIEFAEAGLLHRAGSVGEQFDPQSSEVKAQQQLVAAEQARHIDAMSSTVGRSLDITHRYQVTHSGLAARLTAEEAERVRTLAGVKSIERERVYQPDTYRGPSFIGADQIWNGSATPNGTGTRGQGITIGVLDTGVNLTGGPGGTLHPSFTNDASCGHTTANPKLKSALDCATTDPNGLCNGPAPTDTNGHGSHTASTAGGNVVTTAASPAPAVPAPFTSISGVAPCASLRTYRVCPTTCPAADIQAGMNSILLAGDVKVMNFSISGGNNPWDDNDRRKLDLVAANIVVAASAGNTNATITDPVGRVAHLGPWVMTVAASTRDGDASGLLSVPEAGLQNVAAAKGSGSPTGTSVTQAPIRHFTGQPVTAEGCTAGEDTAPPDLQPFPAGFFNGAWALIHRGNCPFTKKIQNAFNAGAIGVIIRNNQAGIINMSTPGQPNIPAYSIEQTPGNTLVAYVDANPTTARFNFQVVPVPGDMLADFSLRGPTAAPVPNLQKPDVTGPGVNIYAAVQAPTNYGNLSGTSMSSPHLAGAAALVRAVQPSWTASEVKSALMMTAFNGGTKTNSTVSWDPDDVGTGRADLTRAARAGLVMDETFNNYLAANPATGGDVKTLNIPAMRNMNCTPSCTWTRTVRNTLGTAATWNVTGTSVAPGFEISVSPSTFSFDPSSGGNTRTLTITARPTANLTSAIAFGEVRLTNTSGNSPEQRMTVAIKGRPVAFTAVSRKSHGSAGTFDIAVPANTESRSGGSTGDYSLVVSFGEAITVGGTPQASVTQGQGMIGSNGTSNGGAVTTSGNDVVIPLTNVTSGQTINVRLNNVGVTDGNGPVDIQLPVLVGDTNNNRSVNVGDALQTRSRGGQAVDQTTFRSDVTVDGTINVGDTLAVRSRAGDSL